jgi:hypothetical protein
LSSRLAKKALPEITARPLSAYGAPAFHHSSSFGFGLPCACCAAAGFAAFFDPRLAFGVRVSSSAVLALRAFLAM